MNTSLLSAARRTSLFAIAALVTFLTWNENAAAQTGRIGAGRNTTRPTGSVAAAADTGNTARPKPFDYSGWNALLHRYVDKGSVRYAAWKADGAKELDSVLAQMAAYPYSRVLAREERLSFLINAYNAGVIRSILDAYPVAGVRQIPGFFDKTKHPLVGSACTLDEIEKNLIGGTFGDVPMRHFALVCGARGCPPLNSRAYVGDSLLVAVNRQFQMFVTDSTRVRYDMTDNVLHLSELFKWHASDFEKGDQTIPRLVAPTMSLSAVSRIMQEEPRIEYIPFDWNLNDVSTSGQER